MSIRKLLSGRYQARFTGPDSVRRPAPYTFQTKRDARAWLDAQAAATATGSWRDPAAGRERFASYAESWLDTRELTPQTRAECRKILRGHVLPTFGPMRLADITPVRVRSWHAELDTGLPERRTRTGCCARS